MEMTRKEAEMPWRDLLVLVSETRRDVLGGYPSGKRLLAVLDHSREQRKRRQEYYNSLPPETAEIVKDHKLSMGARMGNKKAQRVLVLRRNKRNQERGGEGRVGHSQT